MRYVVEVIREGRSFSTRRVVGYQHGRPLFIMSASYHRAEGGIDHQSPMPEVPGPEGLLPAGTLVDRLAERAGEEAVAPLRKMTERFWPVEFRPVDPGNPLRPEYRSLKAYTWFRVQEPLDDAPALHQSVLACVSDYGLMGTALRPHGMSFARDVVMAASLDHAMWFHRPFRADSWLLYAMDSPSASNAVGFNRGAIFTEAGVLVASVAQEGLIRTRSRSTHPSGGQP
jgi:acyl-CoA thioesterase-2